MTALNTTLWFLSNPNYINRLVTREVRFTMIIQYHKIKSGKTVAIK